MKKPRHLIIGSGNMGQKHAKTLRELGEAVEMVDIEFKPENAAWAKLRPKSVIICTPAKTHVEIINKIPLDIPVFCEKPLLINTNQEIISRSAPTFMACNWTWCKCIDNFICLYYPSEDKYRMLDIIHFMPLCPEAKIRVGICGISLLKGTLKNIKFFAKIVFMNGRVSYSNGKHIHKDGPCDMFTEQMKHWLRVIEGKEKSRLSFLEAENYNRKLIEKLNLYSGTNLDSHTY